MNESPYLEALSRRVLVFDGAMGTSLQALEPTPEQFGGAALEGWMDGLVLHSPDLIEQVHRSYLEVGADVIETCTFQATPLRLAEWGARERTRELNEKAARLARRLADEHSTSSRPRFVAGSMGPTGFLPASSDPSLGRIGFGELLAAFREQAEGLLAGGVDLLIIETSQDILEVKAAIFGAREAFERTGRRVPIQAQASLDVSGRMLLGTDIAAVLAILEGLRVDVVGLNCSTGPDQMREPIRHLSEHTRLLHLLHPQRRAARSTSAGAPTTRCSRGRWPTSSRSSSATWESTWWVAAAGPPRRTSRRLVDRVGGATPVPRQADEPPRLASSIRATELHQEPRPLLIGERVNAQGSRRIKELLLADDYDGIVRVALGQVEGGRMPSTSASPSPSGTTRRTRWRPRSRRSSSRSRRRSSSTPPSPAVLRRALEGLPGPRHRQLRQPGERAGTLRRGAAAGPRLRRSV